MDETLRVERLARRVTPRGGRDRIISCWSTAGGYLSVAVVSRCNGGSGADKFDQGAMRVTSKRLADATLTGGPFAKRKRCFSRPTAVVSDLVQPRIPGKPLAMRTRSARRAYANSLGSDASAEISPPHCGMKIQPSSVRATVPELSERICGAHKQRNQCEAEGVVNSADDILLARAMYHATNLVSKTASCSSLPASATAPGRQFCALVS